MNMKRFGIFPLVLVGFGLGDASLVLGQQYYKNIVTGGGGGAIPAGDIESYMDTAPAMTVSYGRRFNRYLQADVGFDTVFRAANVEYYLNTGYGYVEVRDREYFVPFGGRLVLPVAGERFLLSGGGGGAYIRYQESLRQPSSYYRYDCPPCTARDGWGWYALANASVALDRGQHFRFGVTAKRYQVTTEGEPVGSVPALKTKDRWLQIYAEFSFAF